MGRVHHRQTLALWTKRAWSDSSLSACRRIDRELGAWDFCERSSPLWTVSLHQVLAALAKELVPNSSVVHFKNSHSSNFPFPILRAWLFAKTLLCLKPLEENAAWLERLLCISRLTAYIHGNEKLLGTWNRSCRASMFTLEGLDIYFVWRCSCSK